MQIPLSLVATNLTITDTVDFTLGDESVNIKSGTLTLFANNGFPLDASVQLYMMNETYTVMDSLFGSINTIDEAPLDVNLKVKEKKMTKLVIPVGESKMNGLRETKKMLIKVRFNTSAQPQYIKIYSYYSIDLQLVGDFSVHVQLN
jgi:hypothetical protein